MHIHQQVGLEHIFPGQTLNVWQPVSKLPVIRVGTGQAGSYRQETFLTGPTSARDHQLASKGAVNSAQ